MRNFGIIILNYIDYEVTVNCVESFKNQSKDSNIVVNIVIVDNGSTNNSFEYLSEYFKNDKSVSIIKSKKNLGFANGNNYGYFFLKKNFNPDFYIFSNSDIILNQDGLYRWVFEEWQRYHFGVLGPSIYSLSGECFQSPMDNLTDNLVRLKLEYIKLRISYVKIRLKLWLKIGLQKRKNTEKKGNDYYKKERTDKTIHGSFQIFSNGYFKSYNEPYYKGTFMYLEENILKYRCDAAKIQMRYSPKYKVTHLQAASTSKITDNILKKKLFKVRNMINSLNEYINLVKN